MLLALACLATDWQVIVDKLGPVMTRYSQTADREWDHGRYTALVAKAGLHFQPYSLSKRGLSLPPYRPVRVNGGSGYLSLLINLQNDPDGDACLAYFTKPKGEVVQVVADFADSMLPWIASRSGSRLTVIGSYFWGGNGPRMMAQVFEKRAGKWVVTGSKKSEFESWDTPPLTRSRSGALVPIRIISRTHPEHLAAGHATAQAQYEEQWSFPGAIVKFDWRRRRNTPYNRLDDLYGALEDGNRIRVASICPDGPLRDRVWKLYHQIPNEATPWVEFTGNVSYPDATILGIRSMRNFFHFKKVNGRWVVYKLSAIPKDRL